MIKSLRIDERLIHGQVAVTWCTALNISNIVVANDEASKDEVSTMALKMAAPTGVKVAVKSIDGAIKLLKDPRCEKLNILVLVKTPKDALTIVESVDGIPLVNVGNFGMIEKKDAAKLMATSLSATHQEIEILRKIVALKPESNYQMTPTLTPQSLENLIK